MRFSKAVVVIGGLFLIPGCTYSPSPVVPQPRPEEAVSPAEELFPPPVSPVADVPRVEVLPEPTEAPAEVPVSPESPEPPPQPPSKPFSFKGWTLGDETLSPGEFKRRGIIHSEKSGNAWIKNETIAGVEVPMVGLCYHDKRLAMVLIQLPEGDVNTISSALVVKYGAPDRNNEELEWSSGQYSIRLAPGNDFQTWNLTYEDRGAILDAKNSRAEENAKDL